MHSMPESASLSRRERKSLETATRLTDVCRRLTAERGLAGFTVEEACDEVDISRRTFFNYFPTKEDAVIGTDSEEESRRFADEFLSQGARGWPTVIDDLVDLVVKHFDAAGVDAVGHGDFISALEREPRLLARVIGISRERERAVVALVAQREGVGGDDPRAEAAVNILSTLVRSAGEHFINPSNTDDFSSILTASLAAFRAVLAAPSPRKGQQ